MWLVLLYSFNGYLLYSSLMLKKLDFLDPYFQKCLQLPLKVSQHCKPVFFIC